MSTGGSFCGGSFCGDAGPGCTRQKRSKSEGRFLSDGGWSQCGHRTADAGSLLSRLSDVRAGRFRTRPRRSLTKRITRSCREKPLVTFRESSTSVPGPCATKARARVAVSVPAHCSTSCVVRSSGHRRKDSESPASSALRLSERGDPRRGALQVFDRSDSAARAAVRALGDAGLRELGGAYEGRRLGIPVGIRAIAV